MQPNFSDYLVDLRDGYENDVFLYPLLCALDRLCSDPTVIWNRHASQVVAQRKHWDVIGEIAVNSAAVGYAINNNIPLNLDPVLSAGYTLHVDQHPETHRVIGVTWITPKGRYRVGLKNAVKFWTR